MFLLTAGALDAAAATSSPPDLMSYQGYLVDVNGAALAPSAPANYPIVFRIYDASTGGTILWSEQQIVTVDKGNFSVVLGEGTAVSGEARPALSAAFAGANASDRYLGITVTISGTTMTISPRLRLLTSPFAFAASKAIALVNSSGVDLINTSGGSVGIGTTNPGARLEINSSTSSSGSPAFKVELGGANLLAYKSGTSSTTLENTSGGSLNLQTQGGNVGIGTSAPEKPLTVANNISAANWAAMFTANPFNAQIMAADESQRIYLGAYYLSGQGSAGVIQASDYFSSADHFNNLLLNPNGGGVGIGTTTPNGGLDVVGGNGGTTRFQLFGEGGGAFSYYVLRARNSADSAYADTVIRTDDFVVETGTTGATTQRLRITDAGTLHINGSMKIDGANILEFGAGVAGKEQNAGKMGYGIFTAGMLNIVGAGTAGQNNNARYIKLWDQVYAELQMVASGFVTQSDARIKQITGRPVGEASLENIRRLRVADFRYVDKELHGSGTKRGLIAQEVEKVLPNAVTQHSDFVPDIYAPAITSQYDAGEKTLTIELKDPHGLNLGDMVRLDLDSDQKALKVVAVPSPTRFVVETENQPGQVFVFGKQVNDFRTVDYDHVFTTGISAIQELDRQVQALKKSEARVAELEQKASRVDSLEREVAELKKLVSGLAQGQTEPRPAARRIAARQ